MPQLLNLDWYRAFNVIEALIWWFVAYQVHKLTPRKNLRQSQAAILGAAAFVLFGITDILEAAYGHNPFWLWAFKIFCGAAILGSRYMWRGWETFRWSDREFLFGLGCLVAVILVIILQSTLDTKPV